MILFLRAVSHYSLSCITHLVPNSTTRTTATNTSYTNTTNEHHHRTSSQQFYNLLYNKITTNGQKFATSQHLDMSRCWALVSEQAMGHWNWPVTHWPIWYMTHDPSHLMLETCRQTHNSEVNHTRYTIWTISAWAQHTSQTISILVLCTLRNCLLSSCEFSVSFDSGCQA